MLPQKRHTASRRTGALPLTTEEMLDRIHPPCPGLEPVIRFVFQSEGKRLRPLLLHLSSRLTHQTIPHLAEAAILVEALHNGSLLHDDVMDRANLRRNRPTVNRLWGDGVAILAGDFLLAAAVDLALRTEHASILPLTVGTLMQLVEGQMLELQNQGNLALTERASLRIIEKKTASLFAMACKLGVLLGGGTPEHLYALESFGLNLGIAFQLLDDIQDYLSSRRTTGKEPGRDLAEGKVTLPVLVAFRQADTKDKRRIRQVFADPQRSRRLRELTTLLADNGGFLYTLREAEGRVRKAVSFLQPLPATDERTDIEQASWAMLRENTPPGCSTSGNPSRRERAVLPR